MPQADDSRAKITGAGDEAMHEGPPPAADAPCDDLLADLADTAAPAPPPAAAAADGGEDRLLLFTHSAVLLLGALSAGVLLWADHARWPAMLAVMLLLFTAQLVLWRGWRRLRQRLRERDAALRALCGARRQAQRAAAQRARMMAFVSHELRTPLNGLLGMAQLLRGTALTPEQADYVHSIDRSGRLLLSMVGELMETARAEATGALDAAAPAALRPFEPLRLVEEICELLAPRAHARGLQLACFVDPAIDGRWLGDETRLRQILLNLLGNALKFTRRGGVLVRLLPADGPRRGLRLLVEDTGPGVPPALAGHLFTPFSREAAHDAAGEGGAGLGLAIVQRLLRGMDGDIRLHNRPGKGATFEVFLPLRPAPGENARKAADATSAQAHAASAPLAASRVLLALPGGMHRRALADYVRALGGLPEVVSPDALPELLRQQPDADLVIDAAYASWLRDWLRHHEDGPQPAPRSAAGDVPRIWLLLTPEERLQWHDLLQHPRITGWLLKPLRRRTIIERLAHAAPQALIDDSVRGLRTIARRAMAGQRHRPAHADAHADIDTKADAAPLVLLAEDDPVSAQVARVLLRRLGCRVRHFADGAALLAAVRDLLLNDGEQPVCVLLDIHMPQMDGLEAAQAIRQLEHELSAPRLPLIALSAADEEAGRERIMAAGMDGFLPKPLDAEALQGLLQHLRRLQPRTTLGRKDAAGARLH